jgi:hypothetical protein
MNLIEWHQLISILGHVTAAYISYYRPDINFATFHGPDVKITGVH